jgi:hypothetical protein
VKTTRQTSGELRVPRSTKLKHAFLRMPFRTSHGSELQIDTCRSDHSQRQGFPCQMRIGTLGRGLAPWQVPYQEVLHNSPPAGKDPPR